ncbi:hypothetical protein DRQ36_09025 [bacterium]|nr:MAG: hypothetical protein DRQ36_09025 [bacterium]
MRTPPTGKNRAIIALKTASILVLCAVFLLVLFYNSAYRKTEAIVRLETSQKSWKFPSRVYSDWTSWRVGDRVPPERAKKTLKAHLFESVYNPAKKRQFNLADYRCELIIPEFDYPDGYSLSGKIEIEFDKRWRISVIADSSGNDCPELRLPPIILGRIYDEDLIAADYVSYWNIPKSLIDAVVASEDHAFWQHRGFTLEGILRAARENIAEGRIIEGGSSITQQLVKNLILTPERSFRRKLLELPWALAVEYALEKENILELYLNQVYLGQDGAYSIVGVEEASYFYFRKPLDRLTLSEYALLAGIIPAPAKFDPFRNPGLSKRKRDEVLKAMFELDYIDKAQRDSAMASELVLSRGARPGIRYPDYLKLVEREIDGKFGEKTLPSKGLTIFTTLDPYLQLCAQEVVDSGCASMDTITGEYPVQAALAAIRVSDGKVVAIIGGRSDVETEFNRALDAHRQTGSAFKIFVYAAAANSPFREDGGNIYSPSSVLPDTPSVFAVKDSIWKPRNYADEYSGHITVRRALERSQNVATVNLALGLGLENIITLAEACGIESPMDIEPSLALGAFEVTPFEMAVASLPFPRAGTRPDVSTVRVIIDRFGVPIYKPPTNERRVMSPEAAYIAVNMLEGAIDYGRGYAVRELGFSKPAAGKTGTTNEEHDSWFVGFTPELSAAVWVGLDDNTRLGLTGTQGALPIWAYFAFLAHDGLPYRDFEKPDSGLVYLWIDERTGMLTRAGCPVQIEEAFIPGTEPTQVCTVDHSADTVDICDESRLLDIDDGF